MAAPSLRKLKIRREGESAAHALARARPQRLRESAVVRATLHSRLRPPPLPPNTVERRKSSALIEHALRKKLTLIAAPAGSGKTTLLTQWVNSLPRSMPVAWLSVDRSDDDPETLQRSLLESIAESGLDVDPAAVLWNDNHLDLLTALEAALSAGETARPLIVVLDDAERIQHASTAGYLRALVQDSPPNVHFVVSGRGVPDLHASTLLVRDDLLRIDAAELSADAEFIARLARKVGRALTPDDAALLHARTEGWLAGIKLSLLAQESATDAFFAALWASLTEEQQQLLLACATLERANGELIDAVLDTTRGRALLEDAERRQLFIVRDGDADEYRLHTLFAVFLEHTARRDCPARLREWRLRASRWHAQRRQYECALHHASLAGDREWRLDLLACAARAFVKTGAIDSVLKWSAALDGHDLFSREALWTAHITALILTKRFPAAHVALSNALDRHAAGTLSGRSLDTKLRTLQTMLDMLAGRDGESALELPADDSAGPYLTGTLMSLQAYRLFHWQHFDAARRRAALARDILLDLGSDYGATHANAIVCAALHATAQYDAARDECERLFKLMTSRQRTAAWANAAAALAQVRYEQNRLAEAETLCTEALSLLNSASTAHAFAAGHFVLARTHAARGSFATAWRLLDLAHGHLENGRHPLPTAQVCYEKIRLCLRFDRRPEADAIATEFDLDRLERQAAWSAAHEAPLDPALARLGCAQALRLAHAGEFDRCRSLAQALRHDALRTGFVQRAIALETLTAVCLWRTKERVAAFSTLNGALARAGAHAFTRGVFDECPMLAELIVHAADFRELTAPLPLRYFEKFSDLFAAKLSSTRTTNRRAPPALSALVEPLTDRETSLLRLLAQGLSNQEICARSNIALTTTKWHLKNIFSKLDVNTRTAALARARALRIID